MTLNRLFVIGLAVISLLAWGCTSSGTGQDTRGAASTQTRSGGFNDRVSGGSQSPSGVEVDGSTVGLQAIYFDYDQSVIRADQKSTLEASAALISSNNWKLITIQGHTDERGSEEYNLALGERRADSVRQYLLNLGIPPEKLSTVSFGENDPSETGSGESAWRWNRRVEFQATQ